MGGIHITKVEVLACVLELPFLYAGQNEHVSQWPYTTSRRGLDITLVLYKWWGRLLVPLNRCSSTASHAAQEALQG